MHSIRPARAYAFLLLFSTQATALVAPPVEQTNKFFVGAWKAFHEDHPQEIAKRQQDNAYCIQDSLLGYLEGAATNTAECSSYLNIPAMTTMTTVYPTT